jgi:hypothetical protein
MMGNVRVTTKSASHNANVATDKARLRIRFGNISHR